MSENYNGKIISNVAIIKDGSLYDMKIYAPEVAKRALPGQIVHVKCGDTTTLRRPISICETDGSVLRICYDVRGKGTAWMSEQKDGAMISLLGPLGNGFEHLNDRKAILVGGGIGIYPLLSIGKKYGKNAIALFGFRSLSLVNMVDEFSKYKIKTNIITDDGSSGRKGFVTELLREALESKDGDIIYVCGPRAMMAGVAKIAAEYNVECKVSMEERMGCGVGACLACVCRTMFVENIENKQIVSETYKRVCIDGPVFDAKEIIW